MKYSDFIKVNKNFQTSVNLEYDLNKFEKIRSYIPTAQSVKVLGQFLKSFYYGQDSQGRASVLIGPYGRGKSHLLLILSALTSIDVYGVSNEEAADARSVQNEICNKITSVDPKVGALATQVVESNIRTLPVIINCNVNDINQAFLIAISETLSKAGLQSILPKTYFDSALLVLEKWKNDFPDAFKTFVSALKKEKKTFDQLYTGLKQFNHNDYEMFCRIYPLVAAGTEFNPLTNADVVKLYMAVVNVLCEQTKYTGINIIFDEFSKFLEANLDKSRMLNFKIIQDMAEAAVRSGNRQIHFTCVTHKDILDYSSSDSFKTVEGRFNKIHFISSSVQSYELIANAFQKTNSFEKIKRKYSDKFASLISNSTIDIYNDLSAEAFEKVLVFGCFPLAPLSSFALLHVSELVGQNERTLFTFLAHDTPNALPSFLYEERNTLDFITIDRVYDYFEELFKKEIFNASVHSVWAKADSAIRQLTDVDQIKIVKSIAIIDIIRDERLKPVTAHIKSALMMDDQRFEQSIRELQKNHILSQRDSSEFVLLTANGVDVQKSIENQVKTKIARINISEILNTVYPLNNVLPREHNDKFCMLRYFKQIFMEASVLLKYKNANQLLSDFFCDGLIIHIVETTEGLTQEVLHKIRSFDNAPQIVLCMSKLQFESEELLKKIVASERIRNSDAAKEDPHYFEEIEIYADDMIKQLRSIISSMYAPNSKFSCFLNCQGEFFIGRQVELNHEISRICDALYCSTPKINNEMVNKRVLNSQNLKGRDLAVNWVLSHSEENLIPCMSGFGPEVSIFNSAFKHTGLDSSAVVNDEGINQVIGEIRKFVTLCEKRQRNFSNLYQTLSSPPYGVRKGIIPLFIAYVLRLYKENVVFYFNGKEVELSAAVLSSLNDHPENYQLLIEAGTHARDEYLKNLENLFAQYTDTNVNSINKVYAVVKSMQNWVRALPEYTKKFQSYIDNGEIKNLPDEAGLIRSDLLKYEINSRELLFMIWLSKLSENGSLHDCFEAISRTKNLLDNHLQMCKSELAKKLTAFFIPGYQGGLSHSVISWFKKLPDVTKHHVFDSNANALMNIAEKLNTYNDEDLLNNLVMSFTSIAIEDWNDKLASQFIKDISDAIVRINEFKEIPKDSGRTGKVTINLFGAQLEKTFEADGISPLGKTILSNLKSVFEEYNESIEPDEQLAILAKLIEEITG